MAPLEDKQILMFVGDGFEDSELMYPKIRLTEAGAQVTTAGPEGGQTYHGKHGYPCKADVSFDEVAPEDFDALVIAGGQMPDKLRIFPKVLEITRTMAEAGKPVAAICHGPQILISARVVEGRKMTCWKSVKDDLINAKAEFRDQECVIDGLFVTSRCPEDLPAFCRGILQVMGHEAQEPAQARPEEEPSEPSQAHGRAESEQARYTQERRDRTGSSASQIAATHAGAGSDPDEPDRGPAGKR